MAHLKWNALTVTGEPERPERIDQVIEASLTTDENPLHTDLPFDDHDDEVWLLERWARHGVNLGFTARSRPLLVAKVRTLSTRFPDLHFSLDFREPPDDVYNTVEFSGGEIWYEEWRDRPRYEDGCNEDSAEESAGKHS